MNTKFNSQDPLPDRTQLEGGHDTLINSSTHRLMPVGEVNDSGNAGKQVSITLTSSWFSSCGMKIYLLDYVCTYSGPHSQGPGTRARNFTIEEISY